MEIPLQHSATVYAVAEKRSDQLTEAIDGLIVVLDDAITRINQLEQTTYRLETAVTR